MQKSIWEDSISFHDKKKINQRSENRNYHNVIKTIYEKPTAIIIISGERLKVFPLRLGTRQGCLLLLLLFNKVLKVLARVLRGKKRNKRKKERWRREGGRKEGREREKKKRKGRKEKRKSIQTGIAEVK